MNYWDPYKVFILKKLLLEAKNKEGSYPHNLSRFCCRDFSGLSQVAFLIDLSTNKEFFSFVDVKLDKQIAAFLEENEGWIMSEAKQNFVNEIIPILKKEVNISTEEDLNCKVGGIVRKVFDEKANLEKKREVYNAERFKKLLINSICSLSNFFCLFDMCKPFNNQLIYKSLCFNFIVLKNCLLGNFYAARLLEPSTSLLALADDFRTLRWEEVYKYPEVTLVQIKELIGRC